MISSDIGKEIIKKELPLIPKLPGVYRMLNEKEDYDIVENNLEKIKNYIIGKIK